MAAPGAPHSVPASMMSASAIKTASPLLLDEVRQGGYLTDGYALYRVAAVIRSSRGVRLVELEDCRTLEVQAYAGPGLTALGLRPVSIESAG